MLCVIRKIRDALYDLEKYVHVRQMKVTHAIGTDVSPYHHSLLHLTSEGISSLVQRNVCGKLWAQRTQQQFCKAPVPLASLLRNRLSVYSVFLDAASDCVK